MVRRMFTAKLAVAAGLAFIALQALPAAAARDRTPPTTPADFRVVSSTSYTVSLAWSASTDNSGSVHYVLIASTGQSVTLPGDTTSYTWQNGLLAGYSYTFTIKAVDPAGNSSRAASASTTLPADTTAPSAPTLSVDGVGPTHVALGWTPAVDDGPFVTYSLSVDGAPIPVGSGTAYTLTGLEPGTTHTITVQARDNWQNVSPASNAVSVTTPPASADTTPPTQPGDLRDNGMLFQDGELWLFWEASTDDLTPESLIAYHVLVNGALDHIAVGRTQTILYVPVGQTSTVEVIAVDEAGNASEPATLEVTP